MANLYFDVDTSPMAQSVDSSRNHLNGVTVAVTAMQAAVIASERASAKTICENVDNGFYMLIRSQISQKAVAAYTEVASKQVTLLQLAKALDGVKRQMENDFHMIARRYTKLFHSLNRALETRVKEIDRSAMQLADIRRSMIFDRLKDDSSMMFSASSETLPIVQTALSGKLKQKTRETLRTLSESVHESRSYGEKLDSILVKNESECSDDTAASFLPAIFFMTDSLLNREEHIENVYTAHSDSWQNSAAVVSEINRVHNDLTWTTAGSEEKTRIRTEFLALCERESCDERVQKEMLRLFDESVWEECK